MIAEPEAFFDFSSLARLRNQLDHDKPAAARQVAAQFEALFLQMMLKSMRDAVPADGLFASQETHFYQAMFDQQLAVNLSVNGGIGIADLVLQQLGVRESVDSAASWDSPAEFVAAISPEIERAAHKLGVAPEVLLAQAVLETGWGKKIPRHSDGRSSHNLFGIKAQTHWEGARVAVNTLEFEAGQFKPHIAAFRAYDSVSAAINDYVSFIKNNSRYSAALAAGVDAQAYAKELQAAGYATDPQYAKKLTKLMDHPAIRDLRSERG